MDAESARLRSLMLNILSSEDALSCDSILLSGGLDTSIASEALKTIIDNKNESKLRTGITLTIDPDDNAVAQANGLFTQQPQDILYARKIAAKLGLEHHVIEPSLDDLINGPTMDLCVRVLRTFDGMELRNAVVIASSLMLAKKLGCRRVCTGDGADELFAGYSFMHRMDDPALRKYTRNMVKNMSFCAFPLAKELGLEAWSPYLDPRIIEYAVSDDGGSARSLKIGEFAGATHGKLILRKAFPEVISAGRRKEPIECGSGTTVIPALMELLISDADFESEAREALAQYDVVVRDKERLAYFRSFRRVVLDCPGVMAQMHRYGPGTCPDCKFRLKDGTSFCNVCGLYPARPVSE
ncbi:hypothetical protein LPJ66_003331 [Kickxella alabastrina]|uniref:Uncharacterized protein n=1 Tax=Kickxella alabastrina TaxID=61397 RepID=A0ACC1INB7_9FUNG|nr:hypothetical protein LPJ66_003331 [Kickxella alabastrina]